MHQYTNMAIAFGVLASFLIISTTSASTVPMIYCQPNALQDAPTKVRQLCFALMERVDAPQGQDNGDLMDTQLYDRGTKRQDVDHVFLRFGKRMGI